MKKKRNTRYSSSRSSFFFWFTVTFCMLCAGFNMWLFIRSFNEAMYKLNEKPIATITFKYKTAQRKFLDRVVWDRLRQQSPVYNGDTIRTAPLSEATIWFSDGNKMDLYENTMAQVFLKDDGLAADLSSGGVTVDTGAAQTGMKLSSGNVAVQVNAGSSMSASSAPVTKEGGGISLQVLKGTASIAGTDGTTQTVTQGDAAAFSSDGTESALPPVVVTSPGPNVKMLNHADAPYNVDFVWKRNDVPEDTSLNLEIASDHEFTQIQNRILITHITELTVALASGTWYWRVRTDNPDKPETNQDCASGKLQILLSLPPQVVAPAKNYAYTFRTQKPAVRFIWSESGYATSYELVVADNAGLSNPAVRQRTAMPSSIVSTLGAGTWYWQVTPYYIINGIGLESPSAVNSFTITQRGELMPLELSMPAGDSFVNTKNGSKGAGFSWEQSPEAASYTLLIADNMQLSHPVVKDTTTDNFSIVRTDQNKITNGTWYWAVTQTDREGNTSRLSEVRKFFAVDGDIVQRTVFPPDRYSISSGYVQDMRFTWKTNVPFPTRMQIARDTGFTDTVYDSVVKTSSLDGQNLAEGTYYWRIKADTDVMNLVSPAKTLLVVGPMPAPQCSDPVSGGRAVIRPATPYEFSWTAVDGADYYQVRLYKEGKDAPVYEQGLIDGTSVQIDMNRMEEGMYRWTVQPFAQETSLASRRTGLMGESSFQMKKLRPVKLVSPAEGAELDGVNSILHPGKAEWSTVDRTAESEFILTKKEDGEDVVVMDIKNPPLAVQLDRLYEGNYSWTVKAHTFDDLDISATKESRFTVMPVKPLAASKEISPADEAVFNAEYLRKSRTVTFSWQKVPDATDYILTIRKAGKRSKNPAVLTQEVRTGTSFKLEDLAELDRGKFTWAVEAVHRVDGDVILQHGTLAEASFTIDLPPAKKPKLNKTGMLYGK